VSIKATAVLLSDTLNLSEKSTRAEEIAFFNDQLTQLIADLKATDPTFERAAEVLARMYEKEKYKTSSIEKIVFMRFTPKQVQRLLFLLFLSHVANTIVWENGNIENLARTTNQEPVGQTHGKHDGSCTYFAKIGLFCECTYLYIVRTWLKLCNSFQWKMFHPMKTEFQWLACRRSGFRKKLVKLYV
jgi:hypothetical protein